jgi:hypothetical protein
MSFESLLGWRWLWWGCPTNKTRVLPSEVWCNISNCLRGVVLLCGNWMSVDVKCFSAVSECWRQAFFVQHYFVSPCSFLLNVYRYLTVSHTLGFPCAMLPSSHVMQASDLTKQFSSIGSKRALQIRPCDMNKVQASIALSYRVIWYQISDRSSSRRTRLLSFYAG